MRKGTVKKENGGWGRGVLGGVVGCGEPHAYSGGCETNKLVFVRGSVSVSHGYVLRGLSIK